MAAKQTNRTATRATTGKWHVARSKVVTEPASYVPPPRLLAQIVKADAEKGTVEMPIAAFNKLMATALNAGFDEAAYLEQHDDVRKGVETFHIRSGLEHFAAHGYAEGRAALNCDFDAEWYASTYPDVALAIESRQVIDAEDHFKLFGYAEGRVPNPAFQQAVADWHNLARAAAKTDIAGPKAKTKR
jgi:hypothetical protein